jgi:hypothetical protein
VTATYDPATTAGQVRLLIADTDVDGAVVYFQDDEIAAFLALAQGSSVLLAAAHALEVLAGNEALVSKKVRTRDGQQTDGPAVAKELREQAKALRAEWARLDDLNDDEDWAVAELVVDDFSLRDRVAKQALQGL